MIELIKVLLEYGRDFQYTCYNSKGMELKSDDISLRTEESGGEITLYYGYAPVLFADDSEKGIGRLCVRLEKLILQELE